MDGGLPDQNGPQPLVFPPGISPQRMQSNSFSSDPQAAVPEVTEYIAFALLDYFFCHFLPKNRMSSPEST